MKTLLQFGPHHDDQHKWTGATDETVGASFQFNEGGTVFVTVGNRYECYEYSLNQAQIRDLVAFLILNAGARNDEV